MTELVSITARGLLDAWERALFAAPAARPLVLLEEVTRADRTTLATLPLGTRDRMLLELREAALGARMECETSCPACSERVEFAVSTRSLECESSETGCEAFEIEHDGWGISFRLPTTADLMESARKGNDAARSIVQRCLLSAQRDDAVVEPCEVPEGALAAVAERCAEIDPQADVELDLACPACNHRWRSPFDIAAFLWTELEAWATRMLDEIHIIASRYGWSEAEILSLSPSRRRYYLERLLA